MRKLLALVVGVAALSLTAVQAADEAKTFEGKLVCAKCTLNEAPKCTHALLVKDGDKTVTYYVDDKNKDHKKVCPAGTELDAKVTGKLVEKDGKKTIMAAKVELK
ncbi:MAG: DUF6370 family protein [Fimbriiglobus sp.]